MKVEIINNSEANISKANITHWVVRVWRELKLRNISSINELHKSLTIVFVNKREIRKLNRQFRKKNSVTDILSFSSLEEESLGELIICWEVVKASGFSKKNWLNYLILHGILHLLGFEHEKDKEVAKKMYKLQDDIFEKLSVV